MEKSPSMRELTVLILERGSGGWNHVYEVTNEQTRTLLLEAQRL